MASFWAELKHRKVFQVAAVYAVVAWLIIQVVSVVSEPLLLPDWFDTAIIVTLAVGFPIALILAWVVDMTPRRIELDRSTGCHPMRSSTIPAGKLGFVIQCLVLIAVGFLVVDQYLLDAAPGPATGQPAIPAFSPQPENSPVRRHSIIIGPTEQIGGTGIETMLALSPDGRYLAYTVQEDGYTQIYLRDMSRGETEAITSGAGLRLFA